MAGALGGLCPRGRGIRGELGFGGGLRELLESVGCGLPCVGPGTRVVAETGEVRTEPDDFRSDRNLLK
jgi:hypothetical protein